MTPIARVIGEPRNQWSAQVESSPTTDAIRVAAYDKSKLVAFTLGELEQVEMRITSLTEQDTQQGRCLCIEGIARVQTGMWFWKKTRILQITITHYPDQPLSEGMSLASIIHADLDIKE